MCACEIFQLAHGSSQSHFCLCRKHVVVGGESCEEAEGSSTETRVQAPLLCNTQEACQEIGRPIRKCIIFCMYVCLDMYFSQPKN